MIDSPCLLRLSRRQHCRGRKYTVVDDVSEVNYRSAVPDTGSFWTSAWRFGGKLSLLVSCCVYVSLSLLGSSIQILGA